MQGDKPGYECHRRVAGRITFMIIPLIRLYNHTRTEHEMTEMYGAIYHKLDVIGVLSVSEYDVIKNDPLTPLYIDRLAPDRYAIARNRVVDGVMVPDPDMEIRVDHDRKFAEPLTYQDQKCRKVVYPEPGSVNLTIKNELVTYLDRWLTEMINDGYRRN
jgi:hypothetical protein